MKRIFLILALFSLALTANAQVIHWITFIDTTDEDVGEMDVNGQDVLYSRFIDVINAALNEKGYESDKQKFYGYRTNPENCKRAVEGLTCRPEDIVVFYYIGHGAHALNEKNNYPQMALGSNDESKHIPLSWVHRVLKSKGARLAVTIGMCCNNLTNQITAKETPTFSVNYGNARLSSTQLSAIQNMFLGYKGDFILSSASVGQTSLGGSTPLGDMDVFTYCTVTLFDKYSKTGSLDWKTFFNHVTNAVNFETNGSQTPFFEANLTSASKPTISGRKQPTPVTSKNSIDLDDADAVGNLLTKIFDFLIDNNQTLEKRVEISEDAKKIFSTDATIRIIGQDDDPEVDKGVDKEKIDVFLTRITAASRILLKVVPVQIQYSENGDKITGLKVKEYYKE